MRCLRWIPALLVLGGLPAAAADAVRSACIVCHEQLADALLAPVQGWDRDVHKEIGLGCEACHGGDPSATVAEDPEASMSAKHGFRGAPRRLDVPVFCGTCHADATRIKQFNPQARVDQLEEYKTSVHGRLNARGDATPAVCTDCHGVHGIRRVDSPDSPVYATNVPATCARCHADADVMRPYGIPTDQYAKYKRSVHAAALLEGEDTAAPACNDCHGNHGATPPGVESVANVCGQCHGREANLFRASRKKELFDSMGVGECIVCHGNHGILHPTAELFRSGSAPRVTHGSIVSSAPLVADLGTLATGETAEVAWVATIAPHVTAGDGRLTHDVSLAAPGLDELRVDARVAPGATPSTEAPREAHAGRLNATLSVLALAGEPVRAGDAVELRLAVRVAGDGPPLAVRFEDRPGLALTTAQGSICLTCHSPGDVCDVATGTMYEHLHAATLDLRRAEHELGRARVAGMDVGESEFDLKSRGVTAAVEAGALIHAFDPPRMSARADEARDIAHVALDAARAALAELQYRRRGLAVSLVLVVLVLAGLYLKIRDVDRRRAATTAPGRPGSTA